MNVRTKLRSIEYRTNCSISIGPDLSRGWNAIQHSKCLWSMTRRRSRPASGNRSALRRMRIYSTKKEWGPSPAQLVSSAPGRTRGEISPGGCFLRRMSRLGVSEMCVAPRRVLWRWDRRLKQEQLSWISTQPRGHPSERQVPSHTATAPQIKTYSARRKPSWITTISKKGEIHKSQISKLMKMAEINKDMTSIQTSKSTSTCPCLQLNQQQRIVISSTMRNSPPWWATTAQRLVKFLSWRGFWAQECAWSRKTSTT